MNTQKDSLLLLLYFLTVLKLVLFFAFVFFQMFNNRFDLLVVLTSHTV